MIHSNYPAQIDYSLQIKHNRTEGNSLWLKINGSARHRAAGESTGREELKSLEGTVENRSNMFEERANEISQRTEEEFSSHGVEWHGH